MARNKGKADDLLAELDQLGVEDPSSQAQNKPSSTSSSTAKNNAAAKSDKQATVGEGEEEDDPLADLQKLAAARPNTPGTNTGRKTPGTSARTSEDVGVRSSGEGRRGYRQPQVVAAEEEETQKEVPEPVAVEESSSGATAGGSAGASSGGGGGGGWWGSMMGAATAAVKQAETLAKEIRGNEEAQKWAEQMKGNLTQLQHLGTNISLPNFTTLIQHIAPPISAHERLQIHTTHDFHAYPTLDPLIYSTFSRIMSQVEGGDLLVLHRSTTTRDRAGSQAGYRGGVLGSTGGGWTDGPWWKEAGGRRSLGAVVGLKEGTKLARVSAETFAKEFFEEGGGVEAAAKRATEGLGEANPTRSSDIFLAIQAVQYRGEKGLFEGAAQEKSEESKGGVVEAEEEEEEELVCFAIYLHDPLHSLSFATTSQPFPAKWATWLDASNGELPTDISEIISGGGVDPREWVAEWMEEILGLGVGIVAQRYVARRMGVGEGGLGKGKKRAGEEEDRSGEAARAGV